MDSNKQTEWADVGVAITVAPTGQATFEAPLTRFDARHVGVMTANDDGRFVAVGSSAPLSLGASSGATALTVEAIVRSRRDEREGRAYEFLLNDQEASIHAFIKGIDSRINRRSAFRLDRRGAGRLTAGLQGPGAPIRVLAPVLDISATGCAVRVSEEMERQFVSLDQVDLSLHLPDAELLRLKARICYRRLDRGQVRYGLEYDVRVAEDPALARRIIMQFVMGRQRAELAARRSSRDDQPAVGRPSSAPEKKVDLRVKPEDRA